MKSDRAALLPQPDHVLICCHFKVNLRRDLQCNFDWIFSLTCFGLMDSDGHLPDCFLSFLTCGHL